MTSEVPFYPLAPLVFLLAAVVFALEMRRHLLVLARAKPATVGDEPGQRLGSSLRYAFAQARMFADPRAGAMHAAIFWGFLVLTVGTANRVTFGIVQAVLAWPVDGWIWRLLLAVQNVFAVAVLAAVAYAAVRRLVTRPQRITLSRDALTILVLIAGVVGSELLFEAFRLARYGDPYAAAELVARPLSTWLAAPLGPATQAALFGIFWWCNLLLISAFLVYLPISKHLHVATAVFNTAWRKLAPRGQLPAMDLEAETARFGVRTIEDLTWKDLFDGLTCTECGRCQSNCPAWATGKPLNPKTFIMGLRGLTVAAEAGVPLLPFPAGASNAHPGGAVSAPAASAGSSTPPARPDGLAVEALERPIVDSAIPFDAVWDCVTCGACVEACPVTIEHVDKIVGLRRNLVLEESRFPAELNLAFTNMERQGNPWGQPRGSRLEWTKGLPFTVPVAADVASAGPQALAELEVLYWVGCAASFDDRNRRVARAVATCLHAAGIRFAVLGEEETCTGDPARRLGNEYVFQMLATANIATLERYRGPTILTACPHCFNTLATEYPQLGGRFEVVHHSRYLAGLVQAGRLRVDEEGGATGDPDGSAPGAAEPGAARPAAAGPAVTEPAAARPAAAVGSVGAVTYHDACYLARYNDVVDEPRSVLRMLPGAELREMERHGRQGFCCGAGGGRMWLEERRGVRINHERTLQALATGAGTVATACPYCLVMLRDGLADLQPADAASQAEVRALDIAELLAANIAAGGAGPTEPQLAGSRDAGGSTQGMA